MSKEKKEYLGRFSRSPRARSLAGEHYDASYKSAYWGSKGAIATAKLLAEELKEEGSAKEAKMLLLSTYYSAAGSALAMWKKQKWNLKHFVRVVWNTIQARRCGEAVIGMYVKPTFRWASAAEAWDSLFFMFTHSELEVLMSPYWGIASKFARLGPLVHRDKFTAMLIGREALSMKSHEGEMSYALIAGKMMSLATDTAELYKFRLIVMRGTENKKFAAKDRARLHILLGEYDKAQALGEQENLADVVLKAGG